MQVTAYNPPPFSSAPFTPPKRPIWPWVVGGVAAAVAVGGIVLYTRQAKAAPPATKLPPGPGPGPTGPTVPPRGLPEPSPDTDDWGTGMSPSSMALVEGVPTKLMRDAQGTYNFAYTWHTRPGQTGSGPLWDWLSANKDVSTILVMMRSQTPADAFEAAGNWLENLATFAEQATGLTDMPQGRVVTAVGDRSLSADHWGYVTVAPRQQPGMSQTVGVVDLQAADDGEIYQWSLQRGTLSQGGCCYTSDEASQRLNAAL